MEFGSGGGGLMFVKEEVKPISETQTTSLLSSSLNGTKPAPPTSPQATRHSHSVVPMSPIQVHMSSDRIHPRFPKSTPMAATDEERKVSPLTSAAPASGSALASALASASASASVSASASGNTPVTSNPFHGLTPPASVAKAYRRHSISASPSGADALSPATSGGFTVSHVIQSIITSCKRRSIFFGRPAHSYTLRVAEEGSARIDPDFPELDGDVEITSIGVSTLVLAPENSDAVNLVVELPQEILGLRREQLAKTTAISCMCRQPSDTDSFSVTVVSLFA